VLLFVVWFRTGFVTEFVVSYLLCFAVTTPVVTSAAITVATPYQMQAITGLMLSDGCIRNPNSNKRSTGNYRLEFTFKQPVLEFVSRKLP
jgi:DNA-binding transcriptional regulator WhiA